MILSNLDVRLVDGPDNTAGRLEVYYNGTWGTVCDDNWDIYSSAVVCRQLGFRYALQPYGDAYYGQGTGPIWLDNVNCNGDEASLFSCRHAGIGNSNCHHNEDVSVRCRTRRKDKRWAGGGGRQNITGFVQNLSLLKLQNRP